MNKNNKNQNKENKNQNLEGSTKQPLMSKGMIISLIVTIVVVDATVTTVLLVTSSQKNKEIQKTSTVSQSKPFDYDKQRTYNYDECYCCGEDECYYCDCYDCDDCYCDDCECCSDWDDCGYYDGSDEDYNDEQRDEIDDDYSGEELENVTNSDICEITSSSELSADGLDYSAHNLIDHSLEDAWIEGADDAGVGQSVYLHFEKSHIISGIKINAGYQRSADAYNSTSRPRSLLIEFSSGKSTKIELDDTMTTQSITFDKPAIAKVIKITIESVYEGREFSNTAISEISLF